MIIQILNLSFTDVFKTYSGVYKIFRDVYQKGLLALEIRDIPVNLADTVQKIVLKEKQICYKSKGHDKDCLNLFVPGSVWIFKDLSRKILSDGDEDLGYKIINIIKNYEEYESKYYNIAGREFSFSKSYVMGILNVTPDSFSDGGLYKNKDDAVKYAVEMLENGADIIDIGGESSRPHSERISPDEELARVIPVIEAILSNKPGAIISVDTSKRVVAEEALKKGAHIINDISSATFEPEIINIVKKYNASLVLMHMNGIPSTMQDNPFYENVISEIYDFLSEAVQKAVKAGIKNIFIDPGIGFGKRVEDNFEIIRRLEDFKSIGCPILIGLSRKSFLGKTLNLKVNELDTATPILESIAVSNGARIIRTHNVKNGIQVSKLLNRVL